MQSERLIVKYIKVNNCFAYLPDAWLRKLETKENAIEIEHNGKTYYASCSASANHNEILCLGTTFARSLGINEGDEVFISSVKDVPHLTRVNVIPRTADDREILELQMEKVQSTLLTQIRVVAKGQPIVAWVSKFSSVVFIVEFLEPSARYGKLEQLTEIHVADVVESKKTESSPKQNTQSVNIADHLSTTLRRLLPLATRPIDDRSKEKAARNYNLLQSFRQKKKPIIYRVHPLPKASKDAKEGNSINEITGCPYHVFIPRSQAPKFDGTFAICRVKKVPESRQYVNTTSTGFLTRDESPVPKLATELTVRVFILEDLLEGSSNSNKDYFNTGLLHRSVYVSDSLRITLGLKVGAKVSLWQVESPQQVNPSTIELFSWRDSESTKIFEGYVRTHSMQEGLLINSGAVVVFDGGQQCIVKISPEECTFALIDETVLKGLRIHARSVTDKSDLRLSEKTDQENHRLDKVSTRHLKNILTECQVTLDLSLGLRKQLDFHYDRENILISGDVGSGKTTVCKILSEYLQNAPYFVHVHTIDCRSLKGKKAEMLQKIITTALTECIYYQPSVLFLDDLESITNASTNDEENTPDAMNAARITDMFINMVTQYQETYHVSVIATCAGVNRIGQKLRPARGSHFFRTVLSIPNLEKVDRIDILQLMLGDKLYVPRDVNWDYYGNKTEGWMVQDLVDLAEKTVFAAWKRHGATRPPVVITEEDVSIALKNCTPMSLQGIQLYKGQGHGWSDIGGLAEVKRSLIEILQWPLKYPEIFKNAPIKLQNGVLLYGMPGTGKTMLAKAIANECGVNLISVKGPELLSKYIGVSEESVRNVFERALRAKPCVLFFDEFDSLAPRRGHDSTGVTDRVVNQLLTQMDGVEDREGVAVVAASSRPDLLDPALLRPGRLDKSLYCPLPDQVDREAILVALCKTQNINTAELDLKEVSAMTSGFTGADLNAVVTQARLSAFEDVVANIPDGKIVAEDIKVSQKHLVDSVKSTHPSLSNVEKEKYKRIYARFAKHDNFTEDMLRNQKATLA
ncbi:PREDICTED: peroxisome biogenesis protein 1 [Dufourea novaeangliae]|uniref:peroxisome biogenesis protein 1 n=1 Tax=Dufourea novaeangliae TaxID=178035 RepID=UPI00076728B5|nr:PREDICTED: peroxisome biogenesis protein 1 [Dufourea novaeangliae]